MKKITAVILMSASMSAFSYYDSYGVWQSGYQNPRQDFIDYLHTSTQSIRDNQLNLNAGQGPDLGQNSFQQQPLQTIQGTGSYSGYNFLE